MNEIFTPFTEKEAIIFENFCMNEFNNLNDEPSENFGKYSQRNIVEI